MPYLDSNTSRTDLRMSDQAKRASDFTGRANQKERTRQALLAATKELLAEGEAVTIAKAGARALVSEATAYRYYSDVRSLMRDALAPNWPGFDRLLLELRAMPAIEDRAQRAAEAMARQVLATERDVRALIALSYAPTGGNGEGPDRVARPAFRIPLVEAVLAPLEGEIGPEALRRLRLAVSAVIGAEPVLSLRDHSDGDGEEIVQALGWTARQIVAVASVKLPTAQNG
jgi:AcrR family transcriptional regulator